MEQESRYGFFVILAGRGGEQFRVLMTGNGILCIVICFIRQELNKKDEFRVLE